MLAVDLIERYFTEGRIKCETHVESTPNACPYPKDTVAYHWWTRGYAYAFRLMRAERTEEENTALKERNAWLTERWEATHTLLHKD